MLLCQVRTARKGFKKKALGNKEVTKQGRRKGQGRKEGRKEGREGDSKLACKAARKQRCKKAAEASKHTALPSVLCMLLCHAILQQTHLVEETPQKNIDHPKISFYLRSPLAGPTKVIRNRVCCSFQPFLVLG